MKISRKLTAALAITFAGGAMSAAHAAAGGAGVTNPDAASGKHFDPKAPLPSKFTHELRKGA